MRISDWSLDVCSSDLYEIATLPVSYRPPARFAYTGYNLSTETAVGLTISADGIIRARAAITSGHIVDITSPMFIPDRSEEHTSELQSLMRISYAVFCLKKKKKTINHQSSNRYTYTLLIFHTVS